MVRNEDRSFIEFEEQERDRWSRNLSRGRVSFFITGLSPGFFKTPVEGTKTSIANRAMENGRVA